MEKRELISFIVPAFNAEKTLCRTIDSILAQTNQDYKVIIVDDGSKDMTREIGQGYAVRYPDKIRYIFQENRGLGGARNHGLELVDTTYVSFLDSDDWLMPNYVDEISKYVRRVHDAPEMIMVLPRIYHEESKAVKDWYDKDVFEEIFVDNGFVVDSLSCPRVYEMEVNQCRKVLHMDFVHRVNFSFREKIKWEDVFPHFFLLSQCHRCMGISSTGFYYRIGGSGQITASRGTDRLDMLVVFKDLLDYIQRSSRDDLVFPFMRTLIRFSIWCIRFADVDTRKCLVREVHRFFRKLPAFYGRELRRNVWKKYSKKDAIQYCMFYLAIRSVLLHGIFNDYLPQDIGEKVVKKVLHAGERCA